MYKAICLIILLQITKVSVCQEINKVRYQPYSLQLICDDFLNNQIVDAIDQGVCTFLDDHLANCLNMTLDLNDDQTFTLHNDKFDLVDGQQKNIVAKSKSGTFKTTNENVILSPNNSDKLMTFKYNSSKDGLQWIMGQQNSCTYKYHLIKVDNTNGNN